MIIPSLCPINMSPSITIVVILMAKGPLDHGLEIGAEAIVVKRKCAVGLLKDYLFGEQKR